jgi:hypothetical protein
MVRGFASSFHVFGKESPVAEGNEGQEGFFRQAESVVAAAYHAVMKGGEVQAFLRQGANEIGEALKAFPESLQVDEPGQVFNPIYSDIAAEKRSHEAAATGLATPGELAGGSIYGDREAHGKQSLPSPGEVASEQHQPQQDQGQERGNVQGRSM